MATALKLKNDIKKLKSAIVSKKTPSKFIPKLKEQLKKAENELSAMKKSGRPRKVSTTKGTQNTLSALQKLVQKKKYAVYKGVRVDLKKDAGEGAFAVGRRVSKGLKANQFGSKKSNKGNVYYEYRPNRLDVKQPRKSQSYPKLEKGGYMADGGKIKEIEFDGTNWYLTYIDSTHFFLSNSKDFKGNAYHIGQFRNRPFYEEVKDWLKRTSKDDSHSGMMAHGGEIYSLAENMSDAEYKNKLSRLNEKQKRTYESLVRLGDSPKLALATTLLSNEVKWSEDTIRAYTMADGGMMAEGGETKNNYVGKKGGYNWKYGKSAGTYNLFKGDKFYKQVSAETFFNLGKKNSKIPNFKMAEGGKTPSKSDKQKLANLAYQLQAADEGWIKNNHSEFVKMQNAYKEQWKKVYGNSNYANPDDFAKGGYMAKGGKIGSYNVGDFVKVSKNNDNENYDDFRNKKLIIVDKLTIKDNHLAFDESMEDQALYSFIDEDGEEIPFSLYDYELQKYASGGYMADGGRIEKHDGKLYKEEFVGSNRWFEVDSKYKMDKYEHEAKAFQENNKGNLQKRDEHRLIASKLSDESIKLLKGGMMAKGGKTTIIDEVSSMSFRNNYDEYEMIVISKELNKDGGKLIKDRFLVSAKDIDEAKKIATDLWKEQFGETDLSIVKVMSAEAYKHNYLGYMAKGGAVQHGLKMGDKIVADQFWDNSVVVDNPKTGRAVVYLETGKRIEGGMMAKGGKTEEEEKEVIRGYFEDEPYEYAQGGKVISKTHRYDK